MSDIDFILTFVGGLEPLPSVALEPTSELYVAVSPASGDFERTDAANLHGGGCVIA